MLLTAPGAPGLFLVRRRVRLGDILWPQLGGLVPLERPALHAHLFFGERAARALDARSAARAHLGRLALGGAGPELARRHRPRLGPRAVPQGAAPPSPFGEDDLAYGRVHLGDVEARHVLDAVGDPAPHLIDGPQYVPSVLDAHREVYGRLQDRKSTRLNSSHANISYAVF